MGGAVTQSINQRRRQEKLQTGEERKRRKMKANDRKRKKRKQKETKKKQQKETEENDGDAPKVIKTTQHLPGIC